MLRQRKHFIDWAFPDASLKNYFKICFKKKKTFKTSQTSLQVRFYSHFIHSRFFIVTSNWHIQISWQRWKSSPPSIKAKAGGQSTKDVWAFATLSQGSANSRPDCHSSVAGRLAGKTTGLSVRRDSITQAPQVSQQRAIDSFPHLPWSNSKEVPSSSSSPTSTPLGYLYLPCLCFESLK